MLIWTLIVVLTGGTYGTTPSITKIDNIATKQECLAIGNAIISNVNGIVGHSRTICVAYHRATQ